MKQYIVYDDDGVILSTGVCPDRDFNKQARTGQHVIEGVANDVLQKVVDGKVVDKGPTEIPVNPPPTPFKNRPARISNDGLANILKDIIDLKNRISVLESEV